MEFDEFFRILMGFDQAPKNRARRRDLPALLQGWIYFFLGVPCDNVSCSFSSSRAMRWLDLQLW
jgi:hypothetical protein